MSELKNGKEDTSTTSQTYDPATLLSLYSLSNTYGLGVNSTPTFNPLAAAALMAAASGRHSGANGGIMSSMSPSPASNQTSAAWWNVASQLAAQEYLNRLQCASTQDTPLPAYSGPHGIIPPIHPLSSSSVSLPDTKTVANDKSVKKAEDGAASFSGIYKSLQSLPADTEIVKFRPSGSGINVPGNTIRGRRKTNDSSKINARKRKRFNGADRSSTTNYIPIPEDSLQITKVLKSSTAQVSEQSGTVEPGNLPLNLSVSNDQEASESIIPQHPSSEYYASQALNGAFIAEQMRQQQLATALENSLKQSQQQRLDTFSAVLLMNKLKAAAAAQETAEANNINSKVTKRRRSRSKGLGVKGVSSLPKKNTVAASLLARKAQRRRTTTNILHYTNGTSLDQGNASMVSRSDDSTKIVKQNRISDDSLVIQDDAKSLSEHSSNLPDSSSSQPSTAISNNKGRRFFRYSGRSPVTDLLVPLSQGWRRETCVWEYSKIGIKGQVQYFSPCGKRFRQFPEIKRYIDRRGITNLQRENFSFSSRVLVGDFLKPTGKNGQNGVEKYIRLTADEVVAEFNVIRKENGWKIRRPRRNVPSSSKNQQELKQQKEAFKVLRELERMEKLENTRMEREVKQARIQEAKRIKNEQAVKLKQEENTRKLQEREAKRLQAAAAREHERDRRRQHALLIKQLESKQKFDERERRRETYRIEREKDLERRAEQKRLEAEIISELKRPFEDMCMADSGDSELPELDRIEGLRLSGEAFANVLMVHEFVNTFSKVLRFDSSTPQPPLKIIQSALLGNDPEAEEKLLSLLINLLIVAIDDPGIPQPQKHITIIGQQLRTADITPTNVSEVLRIFLKARAQAEVKNITGINPPESHSSTRDRKSDVYLKATAEFFSHLEATRPYIMSQWIQQKPFLALNPTDKAEILAFICNELLSNRAVLHEIESNIEDASKAKKDKFGTEHELKKLKSLRSKCPKADDKVSICAISSDETNVVKTEVARVDDFSDSDADSLVSRSSKKRLSSQKHNGNCTITESVRTVNTVKDETHVESEDEDGGGNVSADEETNKDEDNDQLCKEDLEKRIEKLNRQLSRSRDDYTFLSNCVRATDLGQDRFRRRYWQLAHLPGIFVEAIESSEPWKLASAGMPADIKVKNSCGSSPSPVVETVLEDNVDDSSGCVKELVIIDDFDNSKLLLGLKVKDKGDLMNTSQHFSLHGLKFNEEAATNDGELEIPFSRFSIIRPESGQYNPNIEDHGDVSVADNNGVEEMDAQIAFLETRLDEAKRSMSNLTRQPIPSDVSYGWWNVHFDKLCFLEKKFLQRGEREQCLSTSIRRIMAEPEPRYLICQNILLGEPTSIVPLPDKPGSWMPHVALRVDKSILEQVDALEDRVASASMQVPNWDVPNKDLIATRLFRPSCLVLGSAEDNFGIKATDPIPEARQRLLDLEAAIQRRYLKAPLGLSNADISLKTITTIRGSEDFVAASNGTDNTSVDFTDEMDTYEDIPRGLANWREAVRKSTTAAQLYMCFYVLDTSITWHKSIMKAFCQLCQNGDAEDSLLLCDGCDKGYHMYCFKPALTTVPDGDWYCFECINKASGVRHCLVCGKAGGKSLIYCNSCPRAYHIHCLSPPLTKIPRGKWMCNSCIREPGRPKSNSNSSKKFKSNSMRAKNTSNVTDSPNSSSTPSPSTAAIASSSNCISSQFHKKVSKKAQRNSCDNSSDLSSCLAVLLELENSEDSWPFLYPVNTKQFPTYRKIVKVPMDMSTIKKNIENGVYRNRLEVLSDVRLIFSNCVLFNEDDSPVGKAGHAMRHTFESRWNQLTHNE